MDLITEKGAMGPIEAAKYTSASYNTVRQKLPELREMGLLWQPKGGEYDLAWRKPGPKSQISEQAQPTESIRSGAPLPGTVREPALGYGGLRFYLVVAGQRVAVMEPRWLAGEVEIPAEFEPVADVQQNLPAEPDAEVTPHAPPGLQDYIEGLGPSADEAAPQRPSSPVQKPQRKKPAGE